MDGMQQQQRQRLSKRQWVAAALGMVVLVLGAWMNHADFENGVKTGVGTQYDPITGTTP